MENIKNKNQLLKFLDQLIVGDKNFKMPKFSVIGKTSNTFKSNYKLLISILGKKNKNYLDELKFDEILLTSYFSSNIVRKKINKLNVKFFKHANKSIKNESFLRKRKKIYKEITF